MSAQQEIRLLLEAFQEGYIDRDVNRLDEFMEMFLPDIEMIGTPGLRQGVNEWYTDRAGARELMVIDFETWGDVRLEMELASIRVNGETGWIAVPATVTQTLGDERYAAWMQKARKLLDEPQLNAEQKTSQLAQNSANLLFEMQRGNHFVWPLRITAVVVRQRDGWKFAQMHFSFPTEGLPGVRV